MECIRYRKVFGIMYDTPCKHKFKYVTDRLEVNDPPFVGSAYCLKECEYFVSHNRDEKTVMCGFPEIQNVV